jgi:cyclase
MHAAIRAATVVILASAAAAATGARPTQDRVQLHDLGSGVYAAIRMEPLGLAVNANSLLIVNDTDVVVVDAQFTREATLETIRALRGITSKPVRWVVNTHWHDDHVAGNRVYADSFPGVRFIAHASTRADLIALGRPNRAGQIQYAPSAAERFERLLGMGLGADSTALVPGEEASLTSALRIIRRYVAEYDGYREVLPDTIAGARHTIRSGERNIELHWFGRGNTRGDLVVHLPAEGVVATGDLVVAPVPFGFNSYPSDWIAVLDSVAALRPAFIVPGHGPVMRDLDYLHAVRRGLVDARDETRAAAARGDSAAVALRDVTLDRARRELAGEDEWLGRLFDRFFRAPVVQRLHDEATKGPLTED